MQWLGQTLGFRVGLPPGLARSAQLEPSNNAASRLPAGSVQGAFAPQSPSTPLRGWSASWSAAAFFWRGLRGLAEKTAAPLPDPGCGVQGLGFRVDGVVGLMVKWETIAIAWRRSPGLCFRGWEVGCVGWS